MGDSAGAHLLATFSNLYTNKEFNDSIKKMYPNANFSLPNGFKLNAIALNCGKYFFKRFDAVLNNALIKDILTAGRQSVDIFVAPVDLVTVEIV